MTPVAVQIEGLEYAQRRHIPWLQADLAALARVGVFPGVPSEPSAPAPPLVIDGPGAALGCLYVVEGARLGARVLARRIQSRLGYDGDCGASSFAPHQGATTIRWRAFGALVEARLAYVPDDLVVMVALAQRTFALHRAVVVEECLAAEERLGAEAVPT